MDIAYHVYEIRSVCVCGGSAHADARLGIPGGTRVEIAVSRSKHQRNRRRHKKIIAFSIAQYENPNGMLFRFLIFLQIFGVYITRSNIGYHKK